MPVDGGARGPGGNKNAVKPRTFKGDGPGANRNDGPPSGGSHFKAQGLGHGKADDLRNGSPNKGPSMGGVLKYIREHGSGEKTAGGSGDGAPLGGPKSPIPTGGEPLPQKSQGNDDPGESEDEMDQEGGSSCGHPGCTSHGKKSLKYSKSNKELNEPSPKGGRY